jgi:DNA-binding PadR family transcriptional regulator
MQIPKHYVDKWIIVLLGKHRILSGKRLIELAKKETECSKKVLPKVESSFYERLRKIEKEGFVELVEEKRIRGTLERFYSLTPKGKNAFDELYDLFKIDEMVPDFLAQQQICPTCNEETVRDCWEIYSKDLDIALQDIPAVRRESQRIQPPLKEEFKTPGDLHEFVFWLQMLKLPRNRLKKKFADQLKRWGLEI